jgi:Uma2 family endonuclease
MLVTKEVVMSTATVPGVVAAQTTPTGSDEELYEIIDGQRVGLPPVGIRTAWIASQLNQFLGQFGRVQNLGHSVCEALFHLPLPEDRNRRPDVAFVRYERWANGRPLPPNDNAWDVLPNLVVEVVSRMDLAEELQEKVVEYFRAGVTLVWVVYPQLREVLVYESPTKIRGLTRADELDGGTVAPGFRLPLTELFLESNDNGPAQSDR